VAQSQVIVDVLDVREPQLSDEEWFGVVEPLTHLGDEGTDPVRLVLISDLSLVVMERLESYLSGEKHGRVGRS
jgi:hypothetical protein